MTDLQWEPSRLGRLTIPQLICLLNAKSPDEQRMKGLGDWDDYFEQQRREDAEWVAC